MRLLFFALLFGICAAKELGLYHENILGLDVYVMSVKERPIDTSILVVDDKDRDKYKSKYSVNQQNIMLVRGKKFVALIDSGFEDSIDTMIHQLSRAGVKPNDITHIILTHAHRDHIGGISRNGKKTFPNATLALDKREYDYWINNNADEIKQKLNLYSDNMKFFDDSNDDRNVVLYEKYSSCDISTLCFVSISNIPAYGHTPGHNLISIGYGGPVEIPSLIFIGDLIHIYDVQVNNPEIPVIYDIDKKQAVQTRLRIMKELGANTAVVGAHMPESAPMPLYP